MTPVVNWSWRAGCILLFLLFIPFFMRKHHFIGNSREAPFYWKFWRGGRFTGYFQRWGTIYWENFGGCWRLAWVSFYGPCSTWRTGHLDQVTLLVWPNLWVIGFLMCSTKSILAHFILDTRSCRSVPTALKIQLWAVLLVCH